MGCMSPALVISCAHWTRHCQRGFFPNQCSVEIPEHVIVDGAGSVAGQGRGQGNQFWGLAVARSKVHLISLSHQTY